jgi:hypothetical protein
MIRQTKYTRKVSEWRARRGALRPLRPGRSAPPGAGERGEPANPTCDERPFVVGLVEGGSNAEVEFEV